RAHVANDLVERFFLARHSLFFGEAEPVVGAPQIDERLEPASDGLAEERVRVGSPERLRPTLEVHQRDEEAMNELAEHGLHRLTPAQAPAGAVAELWTMTFATRR